MSPTTRHELALRLDAFRQDTYPHVVTVSGPTASGKSTLATELRHTYDARLIPTDAYYWPDNLIPSIAIEDGMIHYDHPAALNIGQLAGDVTRLKRGDPILLPDTGEFVSPGTLIVVEGIVANHPLIRTLADLSICVTAPPELRVERRAYRDAERYGHDMQETRRNFWRIIEPDYQRHHAHNDTTVDITIFTE